MSTKRLRYWIAPDVNKLPDFIIGGAMKCGTTSLHGILNSHPNVFIPYEEIFFFDIDNILQHGDFNFYDKSRKTWIFQNIEKDASTMWNWYLSKFAGHETKVKGEDSTTYLASRIAAERIAMQNKPIKLIFMLRQPTQRAYSNYYHDLRAGRVTYSFEDTIRYNPQSILSRGLYKQQLEYWYNLLPREQIKVILFEDFLADKLNVLKDICQYLEIDFDALDKDMIDKHFNKARVSKWINLQIIYNSWLRELGNTHYLDSLPFHAHHGSRRWSFMFRLVDLINRIVNPRQEKVPRMNASTQAFLNQFYAREMCGIDELVRQPIYEKWFKQTNMSD